MRSILFSLALSLPIACSSSDHHAAPCTNAAAAGGCGSDSTQSAAETRFDWVLAILNGQPTSASELALNFDAGFNQAVSASDLFAEIQPLVALAPWQFVRFESESAFALSAVVQSGDAKYWRIELSVDASPPNLISGLLLSPAGDLDPALASFDAIDSALAASAPSVNWLAAAIDGSGCQALHSLNPSLSLGIGSAFKLWILSALGARIGSGSLAWTDLVTIQDRYKSLPSGSLQNEPAGTELPLLTVASDMIANSDNTAADHLLFTLGRDSVEAELSATAHHDPSLDTPFLSTREAFDLKLLLSDAAREAYLSASSDEKRALLASYDDTLDPRTYAGPAWVSPIDVDRIEWFATPGDLCNVMLALKSKADASATRSIYDVLSLNPGIADAQRAFQYVGYKGGSEPGVLEVTWLLQRALDQKWLFMSMNWNDTQNTIDEERALYIAGAARALLGK